MQFWSTVLAAAAVPFCLAVLAKSPTLVQVLLDLRVTLAAPTVPVVLLAMVWPRVSPTAAAVGMGVSTVVGTSPSP